jgi:hypothetical protein
MLPPTQLAAGEWMVDQAATMPADALPPIRLSNLGWVALAILVMIAAILSGQHWPLNFVHVISGVLWTGIDLFMGFVIGPILRAMPFEARRAMICRLMPRTLFILPTLSILTGTTGWFLAVQGGYLDLGYPQFWWVVAALAIVTVLTIQGIGVLLPTNLRVYFELRKPTPDRARIGRLMKRYIVFTAMQGCMQVAIIVVMSRFVTGL